MRDSNRPAAPALNALKAENARLRAELAAARQALSDRSPARADASPRRAAATVAVSARGVIVHCTRAFAALAGGTPAALAGQPLARFVAAEDAAALRAVLRAARTQPTAAALHLPGPGGSSLAVRATARAATRAGKACVALTFAPAAPATPADEARALAPLLRAALDAVDDGVLVVDAQGKALVATRRFRELWRLPDDIADAGDDARMQAHVLDQLADPEGFLAGVRRLYGSDAEQQDELAFKDGRSFHRYTRTLDFGGERVRLWCFRDVTAARLAEDALRDRVAAQSRIEKIAATVPGTIYSLRLAPDGSLRFPYASPNLFASYGVTPEAAARDARAALDLIAPEDRVRLHEGIAASARTLEPWRDELRAVHPEQGVRWIEGHSIPEREADGGTLWYGYLHDVTSRKEAEQALRERVDVQALLAKIAANVPGVLYSFRLSPEGHISFPYASPGFLHLLGLRAEDVAVDARALVAMMHPEDLQQVRSRIAESARTLRPLHGEYRLRHPKKGEVWIEGRAAPERQADGGIVWHGYFHDVTERRRGDDALRASEARFARIFRASPVGMAINRVDTYACLDVNDSYEQMFGYARDEVVGHSAASARFWVDEDDWRRLIERMHADGAVRGFEARIRHRSGAIHEVMISGEVVDLGGIECFISALVDVTERKRTEQALRAYGERLRLVQTSARLGVWDADVRTRKLIWTEELEALYGLPPGGFGGTYDAWRALVHPDDYPAAEAKIVAAITGGGTFEAEFRVPLPAGGVRWLYATGGTVCDERGRAVRVLGVSIDVTQRKEAETALRESEARFAKIFNASPAGIAITDIDDGTLLDINDGYTTLTGYSRDEAIGRRTSDLGIWVDLAERSRILAALRESGRVRDFETQVRARDGSLRDVRAAAEFLELYGRRCLLTLSLDVTASKRAADALRDSEEKFRSLYETMSQGVFYQRADGRLTDANPAALALFGLTREELLGRDSFDPGWQVTDEAGAALPPERQPSMLALSTGSAVPTTVVAVHNPARGAPVWLAVSAHPQFHPGDERPYQAFVTMHDITALKHAEQARRRETQFSAALIESLPGVFYLFDDSGRLLRWNAMLRYVTGYHDAELGGMNASLLVTEATRARTVRAVGRTFRDGDAAIDAELATRDGRTLPYRFTGQRTVIDGRTYLVGVGVDISEQRAASVALAAERTWLQTLLRTIPDLVWLQDLDGTYLYCNPAFGSLVGLPPEQIIGRREEDLFDASAAEHYRERNRLAVDADGPIVNQEWAVTAGRPDGTWVEKIKTPMRDGSGQLIGVLSIGHDITAARRTQAALAASEASYRGLFNGVAEAIYVQDDDGRFLDVNAAAEAMSGHPRAWLIGKTPVDVGAPGRNDFAALAECFARAAAGQAQEFEFWGQRANGEIFPKHMRVARGTYDGRDVFIASAEDISERKRAEARQEETAMFLRESQSIARVGGWKANPVTDLLVWTEELYRLVEHPLGQPVATLTAGLRYYADAYREVIVERLREAWEHGTPFTLECEMIAASGRHFWAELRCIGRVERGGEGFLTGTFQDITGRRQSEQTLRESERRFRALFDNAAVAIIVHDASSGAILQANRRAIEAHGCASLAELRRLRFLREAPYSAKDARAHIRRTAAEGPRRFDWCSGAAAAPLWEEVLLDPVVLDGEVRVLSVAQDITERKRAEARLVASEAALLDAQTIASVGSWTVDFVARSETWSAETRRIFGVDDAFVPIPGRTLHFVHPEDRERADEAWQAALADAAPYDIEYRVVVGGETRWIRDRAKVDRDAAGAAVFAVGTTQDITVRRNAEEDLRKLGLAVEQSPNSIVITGVDGAIEYVNQAFVDITGYVREDVLGRNPRMLQSGQTEAETYGAMWSTLVGGGTWRGEFVNRRKDGELFHELAIVSPVRQPDGRISHYLAIKEDISERRRIGAELERHRHHLQELVAERTEQLETANRTLAQQASEIADLYNNAPCGYHSLDGDGLIVNINDTELTWLGYARDEVVGRRHWVDVVAPGSLATFVDSFGRFKETGYVRDVEYDLVRRDGSLLPVAVSATALYDADGAFLLSRATVFDNTERRARDREIVSLNAALERRADDADAASRAKSAFVANMSHEIRTPLNAIVGLTRLLDRQNRDPAQAERFGKVTEAADHLLAVINDILDMSKIEAGKLQLETRDFDLDRVLGTACLLVQDKAQAKGIEIILDVDPALETRLHGDPTRIGQALVNYLGNAVKFAARGAIVVRANVVADAGAELVARFEVQDEGIGIPADVLPRLFRAFEQADSSTTREYGGTGLGLTITHRLAELMGGAAGVESTLGVGSTFWFTARLARHPRPPVAAAEGALAGRRALVLAPRYEARAAFARTLAAAGMDVVTGDDADASLASLAAAERDGAPYELVVRDAAAVAQEAAFAAAVAALASPPRLILIATPGEGRPPAAAGAEATTVVLAKPITPSALRHGAVTLLVPAAVAKAPAQRAPEAERVVASRHRGARILVVEDNPVNREVVLELLAGAGLVVDVAANGQEAIDRAARIAYDVILMDVQMPVLDGVAATAAIRALPGRATVPILAMTAMAFNEDRARFLRAGMNAHIGKPIDPDALFAALLEWLPAAVVPLATPPAAPAAPTNEPAPAAARALAPALAGIVGLDTALGMKHMRGRAESYERLLQRFAELHQGDMDELCRRLAAGDVVAARRFAHSLKGAAGTVGAVALQARAAALEAAIAAGESGVDAAARALDADYCALAAALVAVLPAREAAPAPPTAAADVDALLDRLEALLAADDMQSNAVHRDATATIAAVLGPRVAEFEHALGRFDYPAALAALRSARRARAPAA